jgi:hypothetical protein
MTTAQACVRGLLLAALLPEAPRWGRSVARFSPRFADRSPTSTAGAMHFADSPQWWGVAPHVEHQVVEGDSSFLACHPSVDQVEADHGFSRTCRSYWMTSVTWSMISLGKVIPSACAVLRFTTNSKVIGCSTGRSAGFAPLRIRSKY